MRLKIHLFASKTINNKAKEINDKNQKFNSGKERYRQEARNKA